MHVSKWPDGQQNSFDSMLPDLVIYSGYSVLSPEVQSSVVLGVPSSGSSADIWLVIEGKITKLQWEQQNIQVVIEESKPMPGLDLQGKSKPF